MQCFEVSNDFVQLGLPLAGNAPPGVDIQIDQGKHERKLLLSPPLLEKLTLSSAGGLFAHAQTRLLSCDLEERSDVWLLPPTKETANVALVQITLIASSNRCYNGTGRAEILLDSAEVKSFLDHAWQKDDPGAFNRLGSATRGRSSVVIIPAGSSVRFEYGTYPKPRFRVDAADRKYIARRTLSFDGTTLKLVTDQGVPRSAVAHTP